MTTLTIIDCDTYTALFVDDSLNFFSDTYNFDFDYGFGIGKQYPDAEIVKRDESEFDEEWWSNVACYEMPNSLSDVVFG